MPELRSLSLREIIDLVRSKKLSQAEVYSYFLDRIHTLDPQVEAFNSVQEIYEPHGDIDSPLAGVPIAMKDLYNEKGRPTTAASHMLEKFVSPYDATLVKKLKKAGYSSIGKVNLDEFAMGGSGENSALRITKNPWDTSRVPGGSSSGSAAAVAAGLVPASYGTDTGGSIRMPASLCGVVGFKPTYGRNSRYGIIAMASSLDTPGTITRTVEDAALLYGITAGHDDHDATSLSEKVSIDQKIWQRDNLKGMKIGIPKEYFIDGIEEGVRQTVDRAIERIRSLGGEVREISLPYTQYGLAVYYIIVPAEVSTNLARYDGIRYGYTHGDGMDISANRSHGLGTEAKRRSMIGTFVLSSGFYDAYYRKASQVRELIRTDFAHAFETVDLIVTPVSPSVAWRIGDKVDDPMKMYLADIFTVTQSLAGLPGMSLPIGYAEPEEGGDPLPVGLQIIGPRLGEEKIFEMAQVLERSYNEEVESRKPKVF